MVKQVDDNLSPSKKQTTTQKTMTMLDSNFKKVSWNIHPTVLTFLMATTVSQGKKKITLRPYVAPVDHIVLKTEKAIVLLTLFWVIFVMVTKARIHRWKPWVWILV